MNLFATVTRKTVETVCDWDSLRTPISAEVWLTQEGQCQAHCLQSDRKPHPLGSDMCELPPYPPVGPATRSSVFVPTGLPGSATCTTVLTGFSDGVSRHKKYERREWK